LSLKRYEMVQQKTDDAQGNTLNFPLLQQLSNDSQQDIIIEGLEFFTAQETPVTFTGSTVISMATLQRCFLTLYVVDIDQAESVRRIPLVRLRPVHASLPASNADTFYVFDTLAFEGLTVIWEKSYIEQPGGWAAGESVLMGVYYKKLPPGGTKRLRGNKMPGL